MPYTFIKPYRGIFCVEMDFSVIGIGDLKECMDLQVELEADEDKRQTVRELFGMCT
jgi:hypothetical protein